MEPSAIVMEPTRTVRALTELPPKRRRRPVTDPTAPAVSRSDSTHIASSIDTFATKTTRARTAVDELPP